MLFVILYILFALFSSVCCCQEKTKACLMSIVEGRANDGKTAFKDGGYTWDIQVEFTLLTINELTDTGTLDTRLRIRFRWFDKTLMWNSSEFNDHDTLLFPSRFARWPQFILLDDQDHQKSLMEKMAEFPVIIRSSGYSSMFIEATTLTSCDMNATFFPRDYQTCRVKLALMPLNIRNIANVTVAYRHDDELFSESVDWPLEPNLAQSVQVGIKMSTESANEQEYAYLEMSMRRNGNSIRLALVYPIYTFSFLTVLIFMLPPESGERVGTSITMVLTMSVAMLAVKDLLPNTKPGDISYFSQFTLLTFGQTIFAFMETLVVLVMSMEHKTVKSIFKRCHCKSSTKPTDSYHDGAVQTEKVDDKNREEDKVTLVQKMARSLDGVSLVVNFLLSCYFVSWCEINIGSQFQRHP